MRPPTLRDRYRRERGVVLFVALVVLVALSIATLAMMRSVDTGTVVVGNLAFKQANLPPADVAVQQATWMLDPSLIPAGVGFASLTEAERTAGAAQKGYRAVTFDRAGTGRDAVDAQGIPNMLKDLGLYGAGPVLSVGDNTVRYVVDRLCTAPGAASAANCVVALSGQVNQGIVNERYATTLGTSVYYRVSARVDGPRDSVTYTQAILVGR